MTVEEMTKSYTGGGIAYELLTERRLKNEKAIELYGFKVYSQNDEDGIIEEIFNRIGTTNKIFVEFGVQNGLECNSHYLLHKGWTGLWLEGDEKSCAEINARFFPVIKTAQLKIKQAFITKNNINHLIANSGFVGEIDLLSVDIDGNDYYVWQAINVVKPRVVVIEYNAKFPPNHFWKQAYNENHRWDGSDWHGASLKALETLGKQLGYQLVGTNISGVNAFFVKQELAEDLFIEPATAEELYNPARYSQFNYISGHPAKFCLVNQLPNIGELNYNPAEYFKWKNSLNQNKIPEKIKTVAKEIFEVIKARTNSFYNPARTNSVFFLPYSNIDLIQQSILTSDNYFGVQTLDKIFYDFKGGWLSKIIEKNESVVVDVGANIGNSTLFFANELHAGKVISFEAVPGISQILKINVEVNNLQNKVEIFNCGLSDKSDKAIVRHFNQENLGGTDLIAGAGLIKLSALDEFNFPKVDFINIDVEGMESQVLEGAFETVKRTRPFISVKSYRDKFPLVEEFLSELNYRHEDISDNVYLFYPAEYQNYHDEELESYDILLPVSEAHIEQFKINYEFINKNLGHDKIVVICTEKTREQLKDFDVEFLNEDEILEGMTLASVREIMIKRGGNPQRAGWYLKQLLNMYYAFVCQKNYYLVWDADTIPVKPIYFLNRRGEMFFNMKTEHHLPYFETIKKFFGDTLKFMQPPNPSFISEGMIIKSDIMRELLTEMGGKNFWRNILNAIDSKDLSGSGFSEFETYGTYLVNKYPQLYKSRPLNTRRDGATVFKRILSPQELELLPYDTISFENNQLANFR